MSSVSIFYVMQNSVYNNEGKWISGDSNLNMGMDLFKTVHSLNPNVHFYVLVPPLEDFADWTEYPNIPNVTWVPFKFRINAFTNRYQLDLDKFLEAWNQASEIAAKEPDVLINNITELTGNMKQVLWHAGKKPKIVTTCYWLDCPEIDEAKVPWEITYQFRQAEGFYLSDLAVFTCESTKEAWKENAFSFLDKECAQWILDKSTIWDFGYSQANVDNAEPMFKEPSPLPIVLFPNRLSGINYTNHKEFIAAVNELWNERKDFMVAFTNPSRKASEEWLDAHVLPPRLIFDKPLSRKDYFSLLKECAVFCSLYKIERYGGCAHREALASGVIPVTPRVFEYERIQGKNYPFYLSDYWDTCAKDVNDEPWGADVHELKKQISRALDAWYEGYKIPDRIFRRCGRSSFEDSSIKFLIDIGKLIDEKLV